MSNKVYIETYGCQMNEYDSELVKSILVANGYELITDQWQADVVFFNTCAIRENAHSKMYGRLGEVKHLQRANRDLVVGLLGCMSQNLRGNLEHCEDVVDIFAGPDSYKRLPEMIEAVRGTHKPQHDFNLSEFEDYGDVYPRRVPGVNAWIAVMRGCDNFCSFCVVPYTRGRERSRTLESVVAETRLLAREGFRQVTLLGQNVNSYRSEQTDFADLMSSVAAVDGIERVRFTSPHPKDFPEKFLEVMAENDKICNHIHLPLQSGNNRILQMMNRTYTSEEFLALVDRIRELIPDVTLTTDIIVGFSGETDTDFDETVDAMTEVAFDSAFMFKYSERKQTNAYRRYPDDVPESVKTERIVRLNELQKTISLQRNHEMVGREYAALLEGPSKKDERLWMGRTDGNKTVILPDREFAPGDIVPVRIGRVSANTLFGEATAPGSSQHSHSSLTLVA